MKKSSYVFLFLVNFVLANDLREFIGGNQILTSSLYKLVEEIASSNNFVFSPLSLEVALALVQSGAKDQTSEEIRSRLKFPNSRSGTESAISQITTFLRQNHNYNLQSATKIYVKRNFEIDGAFKRLASYIYGADVENIDFDGRNEAAATINRWVETQTKGRIRNLVDPSNLNDRTRAVLTNALYFQGNWSSPFKQDLSNKMNFYRSRNDVVKVDMMRERSEFSYFESEELGAKFLELPFEGEEVSMVIVLPNRVDGLAEIQNRIDLVFGPKRFAQESVKVALPKFRIEMKGDFKEILKRLGVRRIFDENQADLSGIAGAKGDLLIDNVFQKTFIKVNEAGVEAAAATYLDTVIPLSGYVPMNPPKEFIADHPFIFYIHLKGLILFAGKVLVPHY